MHVEIHHNDGLLNDLLLQIPVGIQIVIDHFGRPKTV
ncbi:MAG: amidohydrolase, partial [Chitinophagia bacterium]|nr:amidohydrolase [Chitinophagia bacterium]